MAETMKTTLFMLMLALVGAGAAAQGVQDPTRPPAALLQPVAGDVATAGPQLQSILIGRAAGGRRIAVIDGETVRVGERVAGARVLAIDAGGVRLQRGARQEILKLHTPDPAPAPVPNPGKPE
jgi:MSHA biogenesis protein MshK